MGQYVPVVVHIITPLRLSELTSFIVTCDHTLQARQEGGVGGLATPGPATFGGPRRRPEILKIRQNVPF